jgi:hypothetical protein
MVMNNNQDQVVNELPIKNLIDGKEYTVRVKMIYPNRPPPLRTTTSLV